MEWKDVGKGLLSLAPTLAACLGGPAGIIAGGAIKVLTGFLGQPEDATAAQTAEALAKLSPEQYLALRQADDGYKKALLDAGVKLEELAVSDKRSAREMQIAVRSFTPDLLALGVTVGFFGLLSFIMFKAPPAESKDLLNIMLGALGAAWASIVSFYFGSSKGSEALREIIGASK